MADESTVTDETPEPEGTVLDAEPTATEPEPTTGEATKAEPTGEEKVDAEEGSLLLDGEPESKEEGTDEKEPEEGAPEAYEEFTYGEGLHFTKEGVEELSEVFKELNLSQANAQKIVDKLVPMQVNASKEIVKATSKRWAEEVKNDPEIGGERFKQNLGHASRAYREFASPALQSLLKESGLGNHPEVVRLFVKLGNEMSQDKGVRGEGSELASPKRALYPNSNMVKA